MDYLSEFNSNIAHINKSLDMYFRDSDMLEDFSRVVRYSLLAGGKRVRPMLLLEFYKLQSGMSGYGGGAMIFACAVEMIHTYSLIHDDLPCMDNDDYRRGQLTSHKKFGEARAVLAGDALLNKAFELIFTEAAGSGIPAEIILEAGKVISAASGSRGMVGGQILDMENEGFSAGPQRVEITSELKTGALFSAACECGVILGGGGVQEREAAKRYARDTGLAFQIMDDILNVEGTKENMGKSIGSDKANRKVTFVDIYGAAECKSKVSQLTASAQKAVSGFRDSGYAVWLSGFLSERNR
ncbi:MAG: polyprenyl synthetase family protein [Oscillospiraceae bacterium]|nr:polyprenyl synthetase family protein [Oscillospiraceae bacterium]